MSTKDNIDTGADKVIAHRLFKFVELLRVNGFQAGASEIQSAHFIATQPLLQSAQLMHDALRSVFCKSEKQWRQFPLLFKIYWYADSHHTEQAGNNASNSSRGTETTGLSYFSESQAQEQTLDSDKEILEITSGGASDARTLGQRDFRFVFNPHDMRRIEHVVDDISRRMQKRLRRRTAQHRHKGQLDLRRTNRRSLQYHGWPFDLRFSHKKKTPARFLLLLDVSQSMEIYSYLFLRFARGLIQAFKDTDAYAFHTDLIPIGDELRDKSIVRLENKLKNLSSGWLGGTRIAESLQDFNTNYAKTTVTRNTVVIIFSDGYDSGDPQAMLSQILEIKSQCRRLVWVNPLIGRGMATDTPLPIEQSLAAVIPHLDLYTSAHNLVSLKNLEPAFRLK